MGEILVKRFEEPDEIVTTPNHTSKVVVFGETYVAWSVSEPGWHWSKDVKPLVGTQSCQIHHRGLVLSGYMQIVSDQGVRRLIGPGEAYDVHPGHVGWVVGDEPCVSVEYFGVREWAKSSLAARVLTTLLYTDIVGSTAHVARLGDASWNSISAMVPRVVGRGASTRRARWKSAISRQIESPRPVPETLVVKKGSKILFRTDASIPIPSSITRAKTVARPLFAF